MPCHGVSPGHGHPRSGWDQGFERPPEASSLGRLWIALSLTLVLILCDSMMFWAPAGAHPLPAQNYPSRFSGAAPQLQAAFGWWNLTCPVCKGLFTAIDFGLKVSSCKMGGGHLLGCESRRTKVEFRVECILDALL